MKGQNDTSTNTSVTNIKESTTVSTYISYQIGGRNKNNADIICEGKGCILWKSYSGEKLLVPVYYSSEADGTSIPSYSVQQLYK